MPTENNSYESDYSSLDSLYRLKQVCLGANGLFAKRGDRSLSKLLPQNVSSIDIFLAAHWEERTVHAMSRLLADIESGESGFWDLKDIRIWHDIPPVPYDEEPMRSFHLHKLEALRAYRRPVHATRRVVGSCKLADGPGETGEGARDSVAS
ncbi:hypothetical protein VTJ04DRAFT_10790 [Mycothermus thermophilus]|uniref:uncharacterized protein n=1 Tax=Humicola insolens TaxID=85995 RepID=UPI0037435FA7